MGRPSEVGRSERGIGGAVGGEHGDRVGRGPRAIPARRRWVRTTSHRSAAGTASCRRAVACTAAPSVSRRLRRPVVSASTSVHDGHEGVGRRDPAVEVLRARARTAPRCRRRRRARRRPRGSTLRAELVADAVVEAVHDAVERERPAAVDERRVAGVDEGGSGRRQPGRGEEGGRSFGDAHAVGERVVGPDRRDRAVPVRRRSSVRRTRRRPTRPGWCRRTLVTRRARPGAPARAARSSSRSSRRDRRRRGTRGGGTSAGQRVPCAQRKPAKIWRRMGKSQLRNVVRTARRVGRPRPAAQHLVVGAEEHLRVLAVRERPEARVGAEVGRGPLPHAAEHPVRSRARLTTSPSRCRPARARSRRVPSVPEIGPRRAALPCGPGLPSPTPPRWGGACRPSGRTRRPRTSTRAAPARRAGRGSVRPNRRRTQAPSAPRAPELRCLQLGLGAPRPAVVGPERGSS